ncbi:GTP cyclohydrolase II [Nocardia brasiliensis]|uniref:GTP cyclohydrolase II n=1 Tax=Nocardia brasiliensis TaxID=37326 RepID=A0A6G9Y2R5_NOCBR|nr:GTP cyclohydrolase II [Nocardia brasiliensis]
MDSAAAETGHRLLRNGRDLHVRVHELPGDRDGGHVLVFGEIADGCLVRIHSRCLYGDALRADHCRCGTTLDHAMDQIQAAGRGVLIYLEQEGRGAGLVGKARGLRAAQCAESGTPCNPAIDARSYRHAVAALDRLGLRSIRLITDNPDKVAAVRAGGIRVVVRSPGVPGRGGRLTAWRARWLRVYRRFEAR